MPDEKPPDDLGSIPVQIGKATAIAFAVVLAAAAFTFSCGVIVRAFRIGAGL